MIQEVPCVEEPSEQSAEAEPPEPQEPPPTPEEIVPDTGGTEAQEEEAPPAPKPKRAPKAKAKAAPKTKAAPKPKVQKKPLPAIPQEPVNPFASFSSTDLIAEILVRTEGQRQEQKRQLYRSFVANDPRGF